MTRKHFEMFAAMLSRVYPDESANPQDLWLEIVEQVAFICGQSNDRFDEDRFIKKITDNVK